MFLIAQTPRAGEENHCLIVPCYLPISEREVFQRINTAIYEPEGKDYIAVTHKVEQTGSARYGSEILVLVGIKVNQLSASQLEQIRSKLNDYLLSQFDKLVTQTIDWNQEDCILLVYRPELEIWAQEPLFSHLPKTDVKWHWFKKRNKKCVENQRAQKAKKQCLKKATCQSNRFGYKKLWLIIIFIGVIIAIWNLQKYLPSEQPIPHSEKAATEEYAEQMLLLLKQQGFSIHEETVDKAREELKELFCHQETPNDFSNCYDLPDSVHLNNLNHLITQWVKDETLRHFVNRQLLLDEVESVTEIVAIRNQLRQLDAIVNGKPTAKTVYTPFFNNEDGQMAKQLAIQLDNLPEPPKKLVDYLQEDSKALALRVNLNARLTRWNGQSVYSDIHQSEAEQELKQLLSQLCGETIECQIEQLVGYNQAQSIQDWIVTPESDYLFVQLGLAQVTTLPQPEQILKIRHALRELRAKVDDQKSERVFLPLLTQEDAVIIAALEKEFELKDSPMNLLEGLKIKLPRKPYRFFKNQMTKLIKTVEDLK